MKYLIILILLLSGCATGSSVYNQGCRDGIYEAVKQINDIFNEGHIINKKGLDEACERLYSTYNDKNRMDGRK